MNRLARIGWHIVYWPVALLAAIAWAVLSGLLWAHDIADKGTRGE